jgi:type I restriction enzyme, S subunit
VRQGELSIRLDPYYNLPEHQALDEQLESATYKAVELSDNRVARAIIEGRVTPPESAYTDHPDDPIFLRAQNIEEGGLNYQDVKHLNFDVFRQETKAILNQGDIVLTIDGALLGIAAVHSTSAKQCCISNHMVRILHGSEASPAFLAYVLNTSLGYRQIKRGITGSAIPGIRTDAIKRIKIPLPPPDIQRQLVGELEAARAARKAKLAEADALLAGMDAFVLDALGLRLPPVQPKMAFAVRLGDIGKRLDPHFHNPQFQPITAAIESIEFRRLGDIIRLSSETWTPDTSSEGTFQYIEISGIDLTTGELTATELPIADAPSRARMIVREHDILVSLTRPHRGAVTIISAAANQHIASTGFAVIREITDTEVNRLYLWCVLRSQLSLQQMLQRSSGGNYPAITEDELKNILIPRPTPEIQQAIVDELTRRRDSARTLRAAAEADWQAAKARFEAALLGM